MRPLPVHGRGAAGNPSNRFQELELEREEWDAAADPGPETRLLRDRSRSVITTNHSPDVPFSASLNPYRGCEHGCVYCLSGSTPVLTGTGETRLMRELRPGDVVYGTERRGWYRRYVRTRVRDHWRVHRPAVRVRLADGTRLVTGEDHRFLTLRGWKFVTGTCQGRHRRPHLTTNDRLLGVGAFAEGPDPRSDSYRRGYLCGMIRGDGHLASYRYEREGRAHGDQHQFRLALADREALDRSRRYLRAFGVPTRRFRFQEAVGGRRPLDAIGTHARAGVQRVRDLVAIPGTPDDAWWKGFLAGIFDAEGSFSDNILRFSNTDPELLSRIRRGLERFGFASVFEDGADRGRASTIRIRGGLGEHLRFFHTVDPVISRKRDIEGVALKSDADLRVTSVERLGVRVPLYDMTTGTGDFIADGVVSHNCYARPTHEYLGFSAGLDFESRILVKVDAPELLREELADPSWEPKTLAMSGVTDPYQPAERRLEITRGCLEVLAEARHPVGIVTKSRLVTRDLDLLGRLADQRAARVSVSITTLDEELRRALEPRAPTPEARLDAVRKLADAGIPVGVLVAPVIPGLTDHEVPALLEAAAAAGAGHAGYVPLRLPHGVKELFETWLEQHVPARKEKVLGRIRQMRGGRLNDPRFGTRMRGEGPWAEQLRSMFRIARRKHGLDGERRPLSTAAFRRPDVDGRQMELFEPQRRSS